MNLNRCRCGNRPDYVTQLNGLVRISCVLGKCNEIVCARPGMAKRAWNEINPLVDDEQTKPHNPVPTHRPHVAAEPIRQIEERLAASINQHVSCFDGERRIVELRFPANGETWFHLYHDPKPMPIGTIIGVSASDGTRAEHVLRSGVMEILDHVDGWYRFKGNPPGLTVNDYVFPQSAPGFGEWFTRDATAEPGLIELCRGLAVVEPLEDEIPVTVEAPISAEDIVGLAVATVWHQGYASAGAPYVRRALTDMVSIELPIRGPEITTKMAKAYATQLQYPVRLACVGCGYPDSLGLICDAIRSAAPADELPTDPTGGGR